MFETLKTEKYECEMAEQKDISWLEFLMISLRSEISQKWNERKCRKGHDYTKETGNPENGSYSVECSRCGHTVSGYW